MRPRETILIQPGFEPLMQQLGLETLAAVKAFRGEVVKNHRGRRDILRIAVRAAGHEELVLFLKRNWKPYKKDGLASLFRHGTVWSQSRREWENCQVLQKAGHHTASLVAYGEDCAPGWERFSFLLTAAADGNLTVDEFFRSCRDPSLRRIVWAALAGEVQRLHHAGLATPDLFARHIFVQSTVHPPSFCFIDMARLDVRKAIPDSLRARDLAALNLSAPRRFVSLQERLRFLRAYRGRQDSAFTRRILLRMEHLLARRKKFRDYLSEPTKEQLS